MINYRLKTESDQHFLVDGIPVEQFTLEVQKREVTGSSTNRRLRREGLIPAVLYHRGASSVHAIVNERQFVLTAQKARRSQVFKTKSTDKQIDDKSLLVKEIQMDHLKGRVLHVDFQILRDDEMVNVDVPLTFVGEAPGVKLDGGILTAAVHELTVSCLPRQIPAGITIDVSSLRMGQSIHGSEVPLPEGVKLYGNPEITVVSVVAVRQAEEAAPTAAAAPAEGAAAEGAAAPAAEGATAAPAEGADKAKAKK